MPVHLYGHPIDPAGLERLADEYDVVVVEDCAQSAGAKRGGRPTGTVGLAAGASLYPTKNLGAMGDGGVLLTGDTALAERARRLRDYGQGARRYEHVELGLNSRLDELQAAILRSALLPRLDHWMARRAEIATRYVEGLSDCCLRPILPTGGRSAHHLSRRGDNRRVHDDLRAAAAARDSRGPSLSVRLPRSAGRAGHRRDGRAAAGPPQASGA